MLSNTATPKYYGEFRDAVLRGDILVCQNISMQMNRIDQRIADPRYYYDDDAMNGIVDFAEKELTLTDGSDLFLLPSFKLWLEDLYGWYYFIDKEVWVQDNYGSGGHYEVRTVKKRLTNKQFIILGRGGAKSVYPVIPQAFELVVDPDTTQQITVAPTMKQSEEIMSTFRTAITRARGPVFRCMTEGSIYNNNDRNKKKNLSATKKGIENFVTNSLLEVRPMVIDRVQGLRCKVASVDEWLSGAIREDVIGAIEQGASKNDDYIIIAVSSEGTVRNGPGDEIKIELQKILKGEYPADNVSIWWYRLDDVSEVSNPAMWVKANPNIGKTVSYEAYYQDVVKAEQVPSARNDILAKRFGIPSAGFTYFFTYEETLPTDIHLSFWQCPCALGADMSQGDDFCAFTFLFPSSLTFGIKTRAYITEYAYQKLPTVLREKYDTFIQEKSLVVMPGPVLNMMSVYDDLDTYIQENEYDVICFGYDPYNAKEFVERWALENGEHGIEKVPQGAKTESVPLGEIKNLSECRSMKFDQQLMTYCMGNCIVLEDTNGNRKLAKKRYENKIDCVAALLDAYVAYKHNIDYFG